MSDSRDTSWGKVASWYSEYLDAEGTYQSEVIAPNLLRLVAPSKGMRILDVACGEGYFARAMKAAHATVDGIDIAAELIERARTHGDGIQYVVTPATNLSFSGDAQYDAAYSVLALQNIEDIATVFKEVARVLKPHASLYIVLNHPAFRIPKRSSWGWDEASRVQYRRIDGYLSLSRCEIDMHPGSAHQEKVATISYHRSLQDFFKPLTKAGFSVTRLEEWTSHKVSEKGPRKDAEDTARKEIPLFLLLEARVHSR